jgi:hypothetical protein
LDRCGVYAALFRGSHEDSGITATVLGRKNVLGSIPVEFGLPATTVRWLAHHTEVLEEYFPTGFGIVHREVWVTDTSVAPDERLLVGISNIEPVKQIRDDHL